MAILVADPEYEWEQSPSLKLGTPLLVTWQEAERVIHQHADAMLVKYATRCAALNTWKSWQLYQAAKRVIAQHRAAAIGMLVANLYPQSRKRKGPRNLIARGFKKLGGSKWFGIYSGRVCVYRPVGRPALPAAEWNRRYVKRIEARRKGTGKTRGVHPPDDTYYRSKMRPGVLAESGKYKGKRNRVGELWTRAAVNGASIGDIASEVEKALNNDPALADLKEEIKADIRSKAPAVASSIANIAFAYAAGRGR